MKCPADIINDLRIAADLVQRDVSPDMLKAAGEWLKTLGEDVMKAASGNGEGVHIRVPHAGESRPALPPNAPPAPSRRH
jgi:hypothetical protein